MSSTSGEFNRRAAELFAACVLIFATACQTTTTPEHESQWLPKKPPSESRSAQPAESEKSQATAGAAATKPWDDPAAQQKSVLTPPSPEQMREYLSGWTWVKIDENGTRRRSLQLNDDGSFVARSDGQSGEQPAFEGLVVQAKGKWTVKSGELRLMPNFGDPVVVQLLWLGDKRLVMMNGESWIRSQ